MNKNEKTPFSVKIIHASAGTGKTYRLTREFIKNLVPENFVQKAKKSVAITFTEKAACEMRERIIRSIFEEIFKKMNDEKLRIECENQLFFLRISTIHSFCKSLLKRFSFLFEIDPNFLVSEPERNFLYFNQALAEFLDSVNLEDEKLKPLQAMKLKEFLDYIRILEKTHPQVFLGKPAECEITAPVYNCFLQVKEYFQEIKKQNLVMDFNDLEIFTYQLLMHHPQALNMLYDFDESVDFIFVDEFQDTSLLQWNILKEFSQEWISGFGAKAETAESYGLFFVGDKKQSIYRFRGAEPTVFKDADEFYRGIVQNEFLNVNHRSFHQIISFVNSVFEGKEDFPEEEKLNVSDTPSNFDRSFVEIKIFKSEDGKRMKIAEEKKLEYRWVADKIVSLINERFLIYDKNLEKFESVRFKDIAIVMRKRTHLNILEEQLRSRSIPFVNVGGIGFYQEPEIVFLVSLLCVLADPSDDFSMNNLSSSIFKISPEKIKEWRKLFSFEFPSSVIDKIVMELDMYSYLGQQGCANIEKFLMLIHEMNNLPFFEIAQNFRNIAARNEDEPKADIFSEHQDAVRVLTVHGSKGLEFPIVFLTGIEQGSPDKSRIDIMHERKKSDDSEYIFVFRKKDRDRDFFDRFVLELEKEEMRTLYVALTRAKQGLIITGAGNKRSVWLDMLEKFEPQYSAREPVQASLETIVPSKSQGSRVKHRIHRKPVSPISFSSQTEFFDPVSGKIGTIVHTIALEISKGFLEPEHEKVFSRAKFLFEKSRTIFDTNLTVHLEGLLSKDIIEVLKVQDNAYSELQFLIEDDGKIIEGAIDRIIIDGEKCRIYDIKTRKRPEIESEDIIQLGIYKKAIFSIFGCRKIKAFIIFTFKGIIKEITFDLLSCNYTKGREK